MPKRASERGIIVDRLFIAAICSNTGRLVVCPESAFLLLPLTLNTDSMTRITTTVVILPTANGGEKVLEVVLEIC